VVSKTFRVKRHRDPRNGHLVFLRKQNSGNLRGAGVNPSVIKLSAWEAAEAIHKLKIIIEEISQTPNFDELPTLLHPLAKQAVDRNTCEFWDPAFIQSISSGNLKIRPYRHKDGTLSVKLPSERPQTSATYTSWLGPVITLRVTETQALIQVLREIKAQIEQEEREQPFSHLVPN
jgi:hypothetical protein